MNKHESSEFLNQITPINLISSEKATSKTLFFDDSIDEYRQIFLVPALEGWLLHAPLIGITEIITENVANELRFLFKTGINDNVIDANEILTSLKNKGLFQKNIISHPEFDTASSNWAPTGVTFSTTQKCTLRCTYCYAEGGRLENLDIPREIAKKAIDFITHNAQQLNKTASLHFLGEGEATTSWSEFRWAIEYFINKCKELSLTNEIGINTNGVFPKKRIPFISEVFNNIVISLDGLENTNDVHRILPNGNGSFRYVIQTINEFDRLNKKYDIRSTIAHSSLDELPEFIKYIGENTKCKNIYLQPLMSVSTSSTSKINDYKTLSDAFVNAYRSAKSVAEQYQIKLNYSGADVSTKFSFCGATSAKEFLITAKGMVSSCSEILQQSDSRSELFHYGAWNKNTQSFDVDKMKIDKLGRLNVLEIEKCQGCIAKFNCAGDCYALTAIANGDPWATGYTYRCGITRQLLKDELIANLTNTT